MKAVINGKEKELDQRISITELLDKLGLNPHTVAVERNKTIIERTEFEKQFIEENDIIEIIRFMGGGGGRELNN